MSPQIENEDLTPSSVSQLSPQVGIMVEAVLFDKTIFLCSSGLCWCQPFSSTDPWEEGRTCLLQLFLQVSVCDGRGSLYFLHRLHLCLLSSHLEKCHRGLYGGIDMTEDWWIYFYIWRISVCCLRTQPDTKYWIKETGFYYKITSFNFF